MILLYSAISAGASIGLGFLTRALTKKPKPQVSKQEIKITTARYGEPIKRVYGQRIEVGAHVIFRGAISERYDQGGANQGKNRQVQSNDLKVSTTLSVLVCDNLYGQITKVTRIKFDDLLVYSYAGPGGAEQTIDVPNWNGGQGGTEGRGAKNFTIRFGVEGEQRVSWLDSATVGVGPTKYVHNTGFVTIHWDDLQLWGFYNRLPNAILVEVETSFTTVGQIITAEGKRAGLTDADFDVTALTMPVLGLVIGDQTNVRQTIEILQTAHQFILPEIDGKFVGVTLPQAAAGKRVPIGEMGSLVTAMEDGMEASNRTTTTAFMTNEIPQRVEVNYIAADYPAANWRYEQAIQGFGLQTVPERGVQTYTFPMVLDANEANRIAKINAAVAWAERRTFEFVLPWKYMGLTPGDAFFIQLESGYEYEVRLERMEFGAYDTINCAAIRQVYAAWDQTGVGSTGLHGNPTGIDQVGSVAAGGPTYNATRKTRLWLWDRTYLIDPHDRKDVVYYAGCRAEAHAIPDVLPEQIVWAWSGYALIRNNAGIVGWPAPDGTPWPGEEDPLPRVVGRHAGEVVYGRLAKIIDTSTGDANGIITGPVFEVDIFNDKQLAPIGDGVFAAVTGENLMVVGSELIQFKMIEDVTDAPFIPPRGSFTRRYRLHYCRVGMHGTVNERTTHIAGSGERDGDVVVLYSPETVFAFEHNQDEYGKEFLFRAVTQGDTLDVTATIPFTARRH